MFKWYFDWKRSKAELPNVRRHNSVFEVNQEVFIYNGKRLSKDDPEYPKAKAEFDRGMSAGMAGLDAGMKALDKAMNQMERMFDDDHRRK